MKRTAFKRKPPAPYVRPPREIRPVAALLRPVVQAVITDEVKAVPKEDPLRSEGYRRLVASLPCIHCGIHGYSQAAHADMGKGGHIKSDDRTCYPACGPRPGVIGCHALIGSTGTYTREERRALEAQYAARTREAIRNAGLWPLGLPYMEEITETEIA